ncbi:HU family DNA-binding protein [Conchiformibius steedae]|uniref:HU family DNA-binding protein n=1 Tax=Conchiformibius steedae TaxID=153493 RepID=UPI0026EF243B|nr:HU family DNA-binding protein [Conchiformibius steedae]
MNKSELIDAIAQESGLSKTDAGKALDAFTNVVKNTLQQGDAITLVGFGSFVVAERAERQGLNPKTKEPLTIPAARVPKFKPGKALKDALAPVKKAPAKKAAKK